MFARDEEHFTGETGERPISPAIIRLLDDQTGHRAQFGEPRGCIESNPVLARARASRTAPLRSHREKPRERIEASFLRVEGSVRGLPPIAIEEARHDTVTTGSVPDEYAVWCQYPREFRENSLVVSGIGEEAKRGKEIDHGVEAPRPIARQLTHIATMIGERRARPASPCACEECLREIEAVDVKSRFGEQMTVPPLSARHVEDPCVGGQAKDVDESRDFTPIALESEQWLVLPEVLVVEVPRPPLAVPIAQKNTGSRYAPNTLSSAARISYKVQ